MRGIGINSGRSLENSISSTSIELEKVELYQQWFSNIIVLAGLVYVLLYIFPALLSIEVDPGCTTISVRCK